MSGEKPMEPQFRLRKMWVDRSHFEHVQVAPDTVLPPDPGVAVGLQMAFKGGLGVNRDALRGQITLGVTVTPDPTRQPYRIEVELTAQFDAVEGKATPEQFDVFCRQNAPAIVFPYLRQWVTTLTLQGRHGAVLLDPVNMTAILGAWQELPPKADNGKT